MKVVIASDKFKGSLSSEQVAAAIEEGILAAMPDCEIDKLHVADGGDGTAASIVESTGGVWINVKSEDPLRRPVDARFGAVESRTAVIDVATASGIALLRPDEYDPLNATTKGTGILIREAIDRGFRNFNIGVGGSATNDAGTGLLSALGYRFLDARGNEMEPCGRSLSRIAEIDDSQRMPELKECSFTVMCDVDAAFYGPKGAAWLFGPQKGATNKILEALDDGMRTFAAVVKKKYGKSMQNQSYAGAAGGIGGALWAMLDASLTSGIYAMLKAINFEARIADADIVVTGEGAMDSLTLLGKAPYGVCGEAAWNGIPTIAFVGSVSDSDSLNEYGFLSVYPTVPGPMPLEEAMKPDVAYANLKRTAMQVFRTLLIRQNN